MAHETEVRLKVPKKSYEKSDLPGSAEEWVQYINKCHDQALQDRKRFELQWVINLAYYKGYQNLIFNPKTGVIEIPRDIQPLTVNRIGSFIESRHAKLTKQRPVPRVMPDTEDQDDVRGAEYSDNLLMHIWRKIRMDAEYDAGLMQMLICGTSFVETLWDPHGGEYILEPKGKEEGILELTDDGEIDEEKVFLGEVASSALSAFTMLPASDGIRQVKDQPWMIKRSHPSVCEIEKLYPHLRGNLRKEDSMSSFTEYERIVQRLASSLVHTSGSQVKAKSDAINSQALVKTFAMAPNYVFEKGVMATVVGNQLAMIDEFPNDYGPNVYPWVKLIEKEDGFSFWGQSTIERVIPIQKAINRLKEQKAKNAHQMANLKWMVPKGAQLQEDALDDDTGEVVEYNPAVPEPHPAQISPMPNYVSEFANELIVDFRDAGGQRESSVTPPPNVTAGVAMQIAAELADEIIGPIIKRIGLSMELVATTQLMLADQEYIEPRKVKILGEDGRTKVMFLSNVDLKHQTDVHIEIESMFPEFRGAKRQAVLDLWDRRIIDDPKKVIKAFRYGTIDALFEQEDQLEEQVYIDIAMMKKGKMPEFNPLGNHMLYVRELTKFVQTPEFLRLIPERKQLIVQKMQMHVQMLMQQMPGAGAPMGQQNQAAVGTPAGPQVTEGSNNAVA